MKLERPGQIALLISACTLFTSPTWADCDLSSYDRTPPAAIRDALDNGIARFEWATDVDFINGRNWIWHYIKNLRSDTGLAYRWAKADLRRALGSPLQPGKTDCNHYFVVTPPAPDDDAPIIYGTNEASQRAAVYAETKVAAQAPSTEGGAGGQTPGTSDKPVDPSTGSVIDTSYSTGGGNSQSVRVGIFTSQGTGAGGEWRFQIDQTPNVTVAIAMLKFFTGDQIRTLLTQSSQQSLKVDAGYLIKTLGLNDRQVLSDFFSDGELVRRSEQSYFIFKGDGAVKASISMPAANLQTVPADVILFDNEKRPFFATTVNLLAPRNGR